MQKCGGHTQKLVGVMEAVRRWLGWWWLGWWWLGWWWLGWWWLGCCSG